MNHKQRVEKVRSFVSQNKIFSVFAIVLICFLLFRTASDPAEKQPMTVPEEQAIYVEAEESGWRFYPIDLVILAVGGGFCTVMILRERRKAKEGLK